MANPNSKIDQLTCIGLQSRESVAGHNPLTVTLDCNDFRSFFKPDPPNQYKYLVKVTEVTFPTKIAPLSDGNEITMIFLDVKGLDDAGEILFNKEKQKNLAVVNLTEYEEWDHIKLNDNWTVASFTETNIFPFRKRNVPFFTNSFSDLAEFKIYFTPETGENINFNGKANLEPQITMEIEIYPLK